MKSSTSFIETKNGRKIFLRSWYTANPKVKGIILIAHGYAEHSDRYNHTAEYFTGKQYTVYAPDHYGHGRSDGVRADVPNFNLFISDLQLVLKKIKEIEGDKDIYLLGHSMGGAIAVIFASMAGDQLSGLILSGAAIRIDGGVSDTVKSISKIIAKVVPYLPLVPFGVEGLSKDPEVIEDYKTDPYNYNGRVRTRMGREMLRSEEIITEDLLAGITLPVLILHGGKDPVINPECSRIIDKNIGSKDKEFHILENLYHEILNEPEKDQVLAIIGDWLDRRN